MVVEWARRTPTTASVAGLVEAPWSTEKVDIIVHSLFPDGSICHETNLTSHSELRAFLQSSPIASTSHYLLSIEDISTKVVEDLTDCLQIQADAFKNHTRGRLNNDVNRRIKSVLHSELLVSTLLGRASPRKDNYSLTWWKLSTHSLSQYRLEIEALTKSKADATKIVVPHFNVPISNTRRRVGSTKVQVAQVKSELLRQWKKTKDEAKRVTRKELTEEIICTLYANTYRAHQVISEVKNNRWGSACEERLTYIKARSDVSTFYIFLFDKDRTLQENKQISETDYTNARSLGVLNGVLQKPARKPVKRLIREEEGALIPTFRPDVEDMFPPPTQPETGIEVPPAGANSPLPEKSPGFASSNSTRHRFLSHISSQGPLNLARSGGRVELPVLRVKLAFTRMIAQDWDLVLSQMGQTLDDIDRKMSDNTELRKNVPAWRRLLGSWRMTIIKYKAKLLETDQFLRSQMPHTASAFGSVLSSGETSRRQSPDETYQQSIPRSIESELEDIIFSYEILAAAIKEIETRADRSFQALMSSMSILESQKAITQGSSVARLTELAFIFIPLNFACTFFSMQIQEFRDPQPTIGAFFALGVGLMVLLYGIRVFIRSSLLNKIKHTLETKIRETSKTPGTSEIPTRLIISFGWQQLGPFSRALLIIVPIAIVILVLIIELGQWLPFRISGSLVTVLGTLTITIFLAMERYVPALQCGAIFGWIISMLSIGLGRTQPLNSAVMGPLCTVITTVFLIALASIPQKIIENRWQRVTEILLPLWLVEVPIAIICYYYNIYHPNWELWVFLLAIFSVFIVFGIVAGIAQIEAYLGLPQFAAIAAFSVGFPMAMVWSYAPQHGNHLPLYGAIIVTSASVALFFYLLHSFDVDSFGKSTAAHAVFFMVLCGLVAMPVTLVWDTLPAHDIVLQPWVQISVTCGSIVVFATFIAVVPPFSRSVWGLANFLLWGSTAAWLPTLLWAGQIEAFQGLTHSRTNTIHVTWTSILFWTVIWVIIHIFWKRRVR